PAQRGSRVRSRGSRAGDRRPIPGDQGRGTAGSSARNPARAGCSAALAVAGADRIAERWPVFAARDKLKIQTANAYMHYRNRLLGITSASTRPLVETTYRANLEL